LEGKENIDILKNTALKKKKFLENETIDILKKFKNIGRK
jgi:hypothetical protein